MTDQLPRPSILVVVPPPVWLLLFFLAAWFSGRALGLDAPFRHPIAGWIFVAIGVALAAWGRLEFAKLKAEILPASRKNSALVTTGPFRFTRNPMYLGAVLAMGGLSFLLGTYIAPIAAILFFLFLNFISIPYEEEKMERQFGDAFRDYKKRVRRWV